MVQTAVRTTSNPRSKTFHLIRIESARLDRKVNANTKSGARRKYGKDYSWIFGRIDILLRRQKSSKYQTTPAVHFLVKLLEKTFPNDLALTCFRKAVRIKSAETIRSVISISRNVTNFRQLLYLLVLLMTTAHPPSHLTQPRNTWCVKQIPKASRSIHSSLCTVTVVLSTALRFLPWSLCNQGHEPGYYHENSCFQLISDPCVCTHAKSNCSWPCQTSTRKFNMLKQANRSPSFPPNARSKVFHKLWNTDTLCGSSPSQGRGTKSSDVDWRQLSQQISVGNMDPMSVLMTQKNQMKQMMQTMSNFQSEVSNLSYNGWKPSANSFDRC